METVRIELTKKERKEFNQMADRYKEIYNKENERGELADKEKLQRATRLYKFYARRCMHGFIEVPK